MNRPPLALPAKRLVLTTQLLATAATLAWVPTNAAKLLAMLAIWRLGFGHIRRDELIAMALINLFFLFANQAALAQRVFDFERPDFLGMPVYEYVMWGFYTLHAIRFVDGQPPTGGRLLPFAAAGIFVLPFALPTNPVLLPVLSTVLLVIVLALFHDRLDFAYAGYMAVLGALIELVGVGSGQWHYPGQPLGGVPVWSLTMWAGVGLFTRRLILPSLVPRTE